MISIGARRAKCKYQGDRPRTLSPGCPFRYLGAFPRLPIINSTSITKTIAAPIPAIIGPTGKAVTAGDTDADGVGIFTGETGVDSDAGLTWSVRRSLGVGIPCGV